MDAELKAQKALVSKVTIAAVTAAAGGAAVAQVLLKVLM